MGTRLSLDNGIGWLIAVLVALQLVFAFVVHGARADEAAGEAHHADHSAVAPAASAESSAAAARFAALDPDGAPQHAAAAGPDVFGSVAIGVSPLAISARWRQIVAEDAARFFRACPASKPICGAPGWPRWKDAAKRAEGKAGMAQLAFVNARVNALVRYATDKELYGRADHWATLTETVKHGAGDCEDIAIAKMWMLNALGVPLRAMQVVALKDRRRGLDHAVLAVNRGGRTYILDNVHDKVLEDRDIGHYQPMFSVSAAGSWIHGFRRPVEQISLGEALRGSLH